MCKNLPFVTLQFAQFLLSIADTLSSTLSLRSFGCEITCEVETKLPRAIVVVRWLLKSTPTSTLTRFGWTGPLGSLHAEDSGPPSVSRKQPFPHRRESI